eukprot:TRINITY_DN63292_c0_g1_i1.p1 TRINITY_DN63292_c0_g1~~TRINITY_DN63292_c0_g1_i1.p1  ORF type:complete len:244 (+),score=107.18 TRINITY_DN63292_c0_g1_i1:559-1290(+)
MLKGAFEHKDNHGGQGVIHPGGVQWMTAGSGILHSEMPKTDGVNEGLQLWVNLPAAKKMMPPNYQDLAAEDLAVGRSDDGLVSASIISGQAYGVEADTTTETPVWYLDVTVKPGGVFEQDMPSDFNAYVYILRGRAVVGDGDDEQKQRKLQRLEMAVLDRAGSRVRVANLHNSTDQPDKMALRFVLIAGRPLNEPVEKYGPFVMNTRAEIEQAFDDYRAGRFANVRPTTTTHHRSARKRVDEL